MNPLLLALMLQADPPGTPIKASRFVTDTLFPAVGGAFPIHRSRGFSPLGSTSPALTHAGKRDTAVVFYQEPTDRVLAHEAGHILDHRAVAPLILAAADAGRACYNNLRDYFGSSREEYVAEAFARAIMSGRKGFADSTQVDKKFPGTIELIRWLQTRPPFKRPTTEQVDTLLKAQQKFDSLTQGGKAP